ncbi:phospholipase D family protein [Cereibacter johrii]|uniref:phospholipase D family protein n=1 Tax=Cereibacter johrii TaxID=445629 RepID=UPI002B264636|nr:phospholipase D family protein [Cereibacter johrii]MEA5162475.1 phospholipase D family protein [Cereibacter johrii]
MSRDNKSSAQFLCGAALRERIEEVMAGGSPACAVAFLGARAESLFQNPETRIVCDISMGATSERVLKNLGAPENLNLRHCDSLHAKVYLSSRGVVVGSANASCNALGWGITAPRLTEAAVFHPIKSSVWTEANSWFEMLFGAKTTKIVDQAALELARACFRPTRLLRTAVRPDSLLDRVRNAPEDFEGIGFVFVDKSVEDHEWDELTEEAAHIPDAKAALKDLGATARTGAFSHWDSRDVERWPMHFFEFWRPDEKLWIFGRRRTPLEAGHEETFVLSKENKKLFERAFGQKVPKRSQIELADAALSDRIFAHYVGEDGGCLFASAAELIEAIDAL